MKKVPTAIVLILAAWSIFEIVLYTSRPEAPKVVLTIPQEMKPAVKEEVKQIEEMPLQAEGSVPAEKTEPVENKPVQETRQLSDEAAVSALVYPETTQALAKLFENFDRQAVPRVYVGAFPQDFKENGTPALFAKTLLPLILAENEKIAAERQKLLPIVVKIRHGENLTDQEAQFFDYLKTKYDVVEPGQLSTVKELLQRVDRVSPALAVTQALEATQGGKDLTSVFGIDKWNEAEEFVPATYPDLRQTVADYALHLNTTVPYYVFWELRSLNRDKRQPMKARVFMDGLTSYRYGDRFYVQKLIDVYEKYGLSNLDDTQLEKEK